MSETLPQAYGKYVLLRRVAAGGMAEIFRAKTVGAEGFERDIAIKRILPNFTSDESFVKMFKDEANIAAKLSHANIAQVFDFDLQGGTYYLAMEFIEGQDLKNVAERGSAAGTHLSPLLIAKIIADVCGGLHYAHTKKHRGQELNIVHRDVSPHNIMVTYNGEVKLMDFGIAKARQRSTQTQAGLVKGKCAYMSPEQVRGKNLDGRSDLFALGVVMWELLTDRRLFAGNTDYVTLSNVVKADVQPAREINPDVPAALDEILLKALARDRDQRYPTVEAFQRALLGFYYAAAAAGDVQTVAEYMQGLFADDIRKMTEQQAEERQAFVKFMESGPVVGATATSLAAPVAPSVSHGTSSIAPPPASVPPPQMGRVGATAASRAAGTLPAPEGTNDQAATVPLGDLQQQVRERLAQGGSKGAVPGTAAGSLKYAPDDADMVETVAMQAIPRPSAPGAVGGGTPAPRPVSDGTGVAYGGEPSEVRPVKSRAGLYAFVAVLALTVGVGAFFLVRSLNGTATNGGETPSGPVAETPPETDSAPAGGEAAEGGDIAAKEEVPVHAAPLTLSIVTDPADATVFLGGKKLESKTLDNVMPGTRLVLRAEKANYMPYAREVVASPEELIVALKLEPLGAAAVEVTIAAPVPAELTVDGRKLGTSPQVVTGQPGQMVRVEAVAAGYVAFSDTFTLTPGKPLNLPLQKAARLVVRVDPRDATLKVDGAAVEPQEGTPGQFEVATFPVGKAIELEATAPRHRPAKQTVTLKPEEEVVLKLRSSVPAGPPKGSVHINARPWADVFYKGRKVGRTPYNGRYSAGTHVFTLKKGDVTKSAKVDIVAGKKARKIVNMSK